MEIASLTNDGLTAEISPMGATLTGLHIKALPNATPLSLLGQWPSSTGEMTSGYVMWPAIGVVSPSGDVTQGGKTYTPGKHGFARKSTFAITRQTEDCVTFAFDHAADAQNKLYPEPHRVEMEYRLDARTLTITMTVTNTGSNDMYFGAGLHPAFRWPLPGTDTRAGHTLTIDTGLPPQTGVYRSVDGLIYAEAKGDNPFDASGAWKLQPEQFAKDAFFFVYPDAAPADTTLTFKGEQKFALQFKLKGWNGFGIWSRPGDDGHFICVEPAAGVALADKAVKTPELTNVKGLRRLQAGKIFTASMTISVL